MSKTKISYKIAEKTDHQGFQYKAPNWIKKVMVLHVTSMCTVKSYP